jgi:hypothetical protein
MTHRAALRIWIIPPLLALAAFCAYGFNAAGEPGIDPAWRIAYTVGFVLCLAATQATWLLTARQRRS